MNGYQMPQVNQSVMQLSDLIEDLHAIDLRLLDFEKKYGLHSADFFDLYRQGLLDEGELEETIDFTRWAGLYEIQIDREATFRRLSHDFVEALKSQSSRRNIHLTPNPLLIPA